ncbi:MAG: peptide-methionine (S)-S-oxide reductase MsrA [Marinilabilia sp.]
MTASGNKNTESVATFGGGCFWCIEAVFKELRGVSEVTSGYSGGEMENPTYAEVSSGQTGHAEVIRITFDPDVISFRELLSVFFSVHDPTTLNRQGADVGPQYRSAIFYHSSDQKAEAERFIEEMEKDGVFGDPVVTEISSAGPFYAAEEYHQDYFKKNPQQSYCQIVINPKMKKFRDEFRDKLR